MKTIIFAILHRCKKVIVNCYVFLFVVVVKKVEHCNKINYTCFGGQLECSNR